MRFSLYGDGDRIEVSIQVEWTAAVALLKAILATLIVLSAVLTALHSLGM